MHLQPTANCFDPLNGLKREKKFSKGTTIVAVIVDHLMASKFITVNTISLKALATFANPGLILIAILSHFVIAATRSAIKNTLFQSSMYSSPINSAPITNHQSPKNHGHIFKTFRQNK